MVIIYSTHVKIGRVPKALRHAFWLVAITLSNFNSTFTLDSTVVDSQALTVPENSIGQPQPLSTFVLWIPLHREGFSATAASPHPLLYNTNKSLIAHEINFSRHVITNLLKEHPKFDKVMGMGHPRNTTAFKRLRMKNFWLSVTGPQSIRRTLLCWRSYYRDSFKDWSLTPTFEDKSFQCTTLNQQTRRRSLRDCSRLYSI